MKRSVGLAVALMSIAAFFVLWAGSASAIPVPPFADDEDDTTAVSGPLDFKDVSYGTTITECPQSGLSGEQPRPLDKRDRDKAEKQNGEGGDRRLNQDYSCLPQDETVVDMNPRNSKNYVAGANDYRLGWGTSGFYSTTDGGAHWYDGITPFPSLPNGDNLDGGGDPVTVFDRAGVVYYAQINFNRTDATNGVWVNRSTNGGFTWTRPCVAFNPPGTTTEDQVACSATPGDPRQPGDGTVVYCQQGTPGGCPGYDKEWLTAGPRPAAVAAQCFSPRTHTAKACDPAVVGTDRLYVTFSIFSGAGSAQIFLSYSDDQARSWSPAKYIAGSGSFCSVSWHPSSQCNDSQGSQPTVNPTTGQLWVGFINGDTEDEDQYLVVTSTDGGNTFSPPSRVDTLYDINEPRGVNGRADCVARGQGATRAVPTNSCFRFDPIFNSIVADKRGGDFKDDVYVVLVDNRNGTIRSSNNDVFFYKSTDGGSTWIGPSRVNDDRSTTPANRDCGRDPNSISGDPSGCPNTNTGNDQFFPFITITKSGTLNVTFHDRRLDTSSTQSEWPTSRTEPGNYLVWYWGAQCKITQTATVHQTTTGSVPASARQCVAPGAVVNPTVATGFDPGAGPIPGNGQPSGSVPFRNFQLSDVGSNFDYSFRAGLFAGDYSGNTSGPTITGGGSSGDDDDNNNGNQAMAVWTDARNGRGSGGPTNLQPGRNPICEQSDVFFDRYNGENGGKGSKGDERGSLDTFVIAPCPADIKDKGVKGHR